MKEIVLDGMEMITREEAHEYLSQVMEFPTYYGKNLDALYDVLSDLCDPVEIIINHSEYMDQGIAGVFEDIMIDNENIHVEFTEGN